MMMDGSGIILYLRFVQCETSSYYLIYLLWFLQCALFCVREGIVINQPAKSGCYVNVGLLKNVKVDRPLQPGVRVTVEMLPSPIESKRLFGRVVPPSHPQKETGVYWGYSVRIANSFNAIFTECPYKEG